MKIHQIASGLSVFCLGLALILVIPTMAKDEHLRTPKRESPVTPSNAELQSFTLKDGRKFAIVKAWGYKYSPVPKEFDLAILNKALAQNEFSIVIVESSDTPPVQGWYYRRVMGVWTQFPVTDEFVQENPEIFNRK